MPAAVEIARLSKRFGRTVALDDVSLTIDSGAAVALLGPNGAGKTTLMRLCTTLLRASHGSVRLFGHDAAADGGAVRRRIGVLAHESLLYADLTPVENLTFYARLFKLAQPAARIAALIEHLQLTGWAHRPVRTLSRGLLQRCALARVLLHQPDVLFLDEPFTGLDLDARATLCAVLADAHRSGTTLVMSTHDLPVALELCTSAVVLVRGRLAWHGPIAAERAAVFEEHYRRLIRAPGAAPAAGR